MRPQTEVFIQPKRKEASMRILLANRRSGLGLSLLAALAAAFLLVPVASAFANVPAEVQFAGEGAGWVYGTDAGNPEEAGVPPVECHWNGTEIDVGMPSAGECKTTAKNTGIGGGSIIVKGEHDAGSLLQSWEVDPEGGLVAPLFGCNNPVTAQTEQCTVLAYTPTVEIKITATFECEGSPPCPPTSGVPLTIDSTVGSGSGQVNCQVVGDGLDEPCEESYEAGTELELIAEAHEGSTFVAFENGTGDANSCAASPCMFTLNGDSTLDARFEQEPPAVTTTAGAAGITQTEATVEGTVNPNGSEVTACKVEYGETTSYGSETSCASPPGSGTSPVAVEAALSGLSPETTYHFRFVATNGGGTGEGEDREFTTEAIQPPTVLTEAASPVGKTTATLNGTVNPHGSEVSACEFEYGTTTGYGSTAACVPSPGSGSGAVSVHAEVSGLTQLTEYHFRLLATNGGGTEEGSDETFTTVSLTPPTVTTTAGATGIAQTEATVEGTVNPNGLNVESCEVEYGTTTGYGSTAACVPSPGSGTSAVAVEAALSGLSPETTYHFRFVATNEDGTGDGSDQQFTTLPLKPSVTIAAATGAAQTALTLNGAVNPNGSNVSACEFEYGTTTSYGSTAACVPAAPGAGTSPVAVDAELTGLSANTTYHYRLKATNGGGTSTSGDETASTLPNPPTVTTTEGATGIAQTEATVHGTVNPNGSNVSACKVEYGTTTAYGSEASCASLPGSGTSAVGVEAALSGLSPETTYHFRFVATNGGGTGHGSDQSFTTLSNQHSLTTGQSGSGSGSFQCDAGSGPEACQSSYPTGTTVTVIAVPAASSDFAEWSGECDAVSGDECEVTLDADKTVAAVFTLKSLALSVAKAGTGTGTVTSSPAGISCGGACSHAYLYGTTVTMTASPGSISDFSGWSGCDEVAGSWCKVSLSAARTVTATFTQRTKALTLETTGPGSGSVSCDGGPCASRYPEGATVTLHANPDSGSTFYGWAGAGCTSGGDCVVTLDRDTTVAASFELLPPPPPAPAAGAHHGKRSPCAKPARRAKKLSGRAKRLRRNAGKLARNGHRAKARRLRGKAKALARQAHRLSRGAKRCRASRSRGDA